MGYVEMTRPANRVAQILYRVLDGEIPHVKYLQGILDAHGWPDVDELRNQTEQLRRLRNLPVTFDVQETRRAWTTCSACGKPSGPIFAAHVAAYHRQPAQQPAQQPAHE